MNYIFPLAFMALTQSTTALLIILGLTGHQGDAAVVAIVQGATLATFYALSANSRNLILDDSRRVDQNVVLAVRLGLLIPLASIAIFVSIHAVEVSWTFVVMLVVRRCGEWISELHVSTIEFEHDKKRAVRILAAEAVTWFIAVGVYLSSGPTFRHAGILVWALLPALRSVPFLIRQQLPGWRKVWRSLPVLYPHVGSTLVIGITIFVFRLAILGIVGKETAGDLLTAFALGGILGSIFANVLGPSIGLHERRTGQTRLPREIGYLTYLLTVSGLLLTGFTIFGSMPLGWLGKSNLFWMAAGLSLLGGSVMILAQRIRVRLIQNKDGEAIFSADVLANTAMVGSVPLAYLWGGANGLASLYLVNSVILFLLYWFNDRSENLAVKLDKDPHKRLMLALGVAIFFPIFFQLSGGIFRAPYTIWDSGGSIRNLPLPISVAAMIVGLVWLGAYRRTRLSFSVISAFFVIMFGTSVIMTGSAVLEERHKILLLLQYLLPLFALPLGNVFANREEQEGYVVERSAFWVVSILVPLQLLSGWIHGEYDLSPYVFLFSVYQHFQYVPVIIVSAYLLGIYALWQRGNYRVWAIVMAPWVGIYVYASYSLLANFELLAGLVIFSVLRNVSVRDRRAILPVVLAILAAVGFHLIAPSPQDHSPTAYKDYAYDKKIGVLLHVSASKRQVPVNVSRRLDDWRNYGNGILESTRMFFFGHAKPFARNVSTSAHNYYLDLAYNFGVLSLIPILLLIAYTIQQLVRYRRQIVQRDVLLCLSAVVLFLVLIDSNLKVTLREPYPGIVVFFLWGLLLGRLHNLRNPTGLV